MRFKILKRLIIGLFFFLAVGLGYSQLIKGDYYYRLSQNNRIKLVKLPAPRGVILDRNQKVLAGSRTMLNLAILRQGTKDIKETFARLSPILGISEELLQRRFKRNFYAPFAAVVVAHDISKETAIILEAQESEIPGILIQSELLRDYPYQKSLAHVLGYLGMVSEDELRGLKEYGLPIRNLVGRGGLEGAFNDSLRGRPGGMQIEVNNLGYQVRLLSERQPQAGEDLQLTIDIDLQDFIEKLFQDSAGSCVVMSTESGAVISMISSPGFNPNDFIFAVNEKPQAQNIVRQLLTSKDAVLVNRSISSTAPPGSIFKLVIAAAALESNKAVAQTTFNCRGSVDVGNRTFYCWKRDGHGAQTLEEAIAHSCNVFFYRMGLALGADKITFFARKFGLGSLTGIDLPYEAGGLVPSKNWKLKTYKEAWYDGETANFSIGQGYLLVTSLQIAQMISVVANDGYIVKPYLVAAEAGKNTKPVRKKINFKPETLSIIREGMRRVVQDPEGTGHAAYLPGVQWAAKTGTAQTAYGSSHGWFAGFYPFKTPRLAIVVFLEHGGIGGGAAAMMAKQIAEYVAENNLLQLN